MKIELQEAERPEFVVYSDDHEFSKTGGVVAWRLWRYP